MATSGARNAGLWIRVVKGSGPSQAKLKNESQLEWGTGLDSYTYKSSLRTVWFELYSMYQGSSDPHQVRDSVSDEIDVIIWGGRQEPFRSRFRLNWQRLLRRRMKNDCLALPSLYFRAWCLRVEISAQDWINEESACTNQYEPCCIRCVDNRYPKEAVE